MGDIIPDMPPLAFVFLIVVTALLVMIPTRRLFLAGWTPPSLTAYFLILVALALLVAEVRGPARYLVPILVIAYIAPFVTARDGIARLRGRISGAPPVPRAPPDSADKKDSRGRRADERANRRDPGAGRPEPKNVTPKDARPPDTGG